MFQKSFKFRIFLIFLLPTIALVYFSFYFISMKYKELNMTSRLLFSSKMTKSISQFVHNIQLERGLSAGYIVTKNSEKYREELLRQQGFTDKAYAKFLVELDYYSSNKEMASQLSFYKNKSKIKNVLKQLHLLRDTRNSILNSSIDFKKEIGYYTNINKNLIGIIRTLSSPFLNYNGNSMDIYKLQRLEENAGLERAYVYSLLLSKSFIKKDSKKIEILIIAQENFLKEFLADASLEDISLYNNFVSVKAQKDIQKLRNLFFQGKLNAKDAKEWFKVSSKRIDEFNKLSIKIIDVYLKNVSKIHNDATNALFITLLLWILAISSFLFLIFILNKLIDSEARLLENLRVASYAFDAHEAMTITDPNGTILNVNKAFTEITGYDAKEVIGKNPRVLKSFKHPDEFYKDMWRDLHTKGYWSSDIYNKRKNDEIYMERLSITAIKDKKDITTHYIAQFLDISELKKAQEDAAYQAKHDSLTKLPNRSAMIEKLQEELIRARRHNFLDAFLFIDLDIFKSVNDNYGHMVGDKLLFSVAQRFKNSIRKEDYLARISGDEFCIILLDLGNNEEKTSIFVKEICRKILYSLSKPFFIDDYKIKISASVGIKIFPQDSDDINDVINGADAAMYKAKSSGKNQSVFYNKLIEHRIKEISLLEDELKEGFKKDQFIFYFQPKVSVDMKTVLGAELLVRWRHPTRGLLYPNDFLQAIKDMGVISKITVLALKDACRFIKTDEKHLNGTLSINISSFELISDGFVKKIEDIISSYEINPSFVELEILEDEFIKDFDAIILNINRLKKFGIKFSIDDFGTGYSSISYLKKLPVDTLKIDKYFIQNISDDSNKELVKMLINIANIFKLSIVIEGVEDKDQLEFIVQNGAKQFQGFYFSKAVDVLEYKKLSNCL